MIYTKGILPKLPKPGEEGDLPDEKPDPGSKGL
jgi:hypothetical protein